MKIKNKLLLLIILLFNCCIQQCLASQQNMPYASFWDKIIQGMEVSKQGKRDHYVADCKRLAITENQKIKQKDNSFIRVATYNVHVWADPYFKFRKSDISPELATIIQNLGINPTTKLSPIFDTIKDLNADVLILQEAGSDNNPEFEDYKKILQALGYEYGLQCIGNMNKDRDVPYGPFGNWILSKYPFVKDPQVFYFDAQMGEDRVPIGEYVDRNVIYGKIQLPNNQIVSIYATHLDVFDHTEKVRFDQTRELMKLVQQDQSNNIIVVGDLNSKRPQDYENQPSLWEIISQEDIKLYGIINSSMQTKVVDKDEKDQQTSPTLVLDYIKSQGFIDNFSRHHQATPGFTVWSGTTVDFMMLKNNSWNLPIENCGVYFSAESDHIPVFMDISII